MSRRTLVVSALAVLVASTTLSGSAGASPTAAEAVTLSVERMEEPLTTNIRSRFTGTVSSGTAGEDVTVMQQVCGWGHATAVAGTQTKSGGFWEAEPVSSYVIARSAAYTARWKDETSAPVVIHPKVQVYLMSRGKRQLKFNVSIATARQAMKGKIVVLERLRAKKWRVVQRTRLTVDGPAYFGAMFAVTRGWTVRVRVPAETAAPCFLPNATKKRRIR